MQLKATKRDEPKYMQYASIVGQILRGLPAISGPFSPIYVHFDQHIYVSLCLASEDLWAWINNCILQHSMGCNYLAMP